MAYAATFSNCETLTSPDAAELARVALASKLPGLIIFGYGFSSLRELEPFADSLRILKISGAPRLSSLEGIELLPELEELVLGTPTGSSGSGRFIAVKSFAPLEALPRLKRLVLHDVRPEDLDLSPIMRLQQLEEIDIGGVPEFTLEHHARLAVALPHAKGRCLGPYVIIRGVGRCKKCNGQSVLLNGAPPKARKWLCPNCNAKPLRAHVEKWEQLTGRPYVEPELDPPAL